MSLYRDHILPRGINWCLNSKECRALRSEVTRPLQGRVLEVGFGSGLNLPYMSQTVEVLYAVDPSLTGRELAADRIRRAPFHVEFIGLDGQRLPLDTGSVDHVLSTWTLCSIQDPRVALGEVKRVLKPGGSFHFLEHGLARDTRVAAWQRRLNPLQKLVAGGCQLVWPIAQLVEDAGFHTDSLDNFYMTGPRVLTYMYRGIARVA